MSVVYPIELERSAYGQLSSRKMIGLLCSWEGTESQLTAASAVAVMLGAPPPGQGAKFHAAKALAATLAAWPIVTCLLASRCRS